MHLPARVLRTIRKHQLFRRGARVLVAFSGGPDSAALLHVLRALEERGELRVAGLGHLNHQLRGEESDADEALSREIASAVGLPVEVGRADVAALARATRRSVEDAARSARYAFLHQAADRLAAEAIAVGHSEDDQAETFLLRLLRGAGARGLAGIRPRAGRVVRPLLEISRADLRRYAAEHDLRFREDASNADVRFPRNHIRHRVLPELERVTPRAARLLARQAELARQDEDYLEGEAAARLPALMADRDGVLHLDAAGLAALPAALGSRVVRAAIELRAPARPLSRDHIERTLGLCRARDGASVALPGQIAARDGAVIRLSDLTGPSGVNSFRFPLSIPGEVLVAGWEVSADPAGRAAELTLPPARGGLAVIPAASVREPLAVRTRRHGDRFRPLGMGGRARKLQDYLVDRKIPRAERDRLPLVVDRDDRIVWVVGQSVAEDFRVTAPELRVILLKARRLGGPG